MSYSSISKPHPFKRALISGLLTASLTGALALAASLGITPPAFAATVNTANSTPTVTLIIDDRTITADPAPMIRNDRTVVPLRVVSESLGAEVTWNAADRSVLIEKGSRRILLRIDRSLVDYTLDGQKYYQFSDVQPFIHQDRTFVPLRLISNALGVSIDWEGSTRTVRVDSNKSADLEAFFDIKLTSVKANALIQGTTDLQASFAAQPPASAEKINYLLVDPATGKGLVIAQGSDLTAAYTWQPKIQDQGSRILATALYDAAGRFLGGDALPVTVSLSPAAALQVTGPAVGQPAIGQVSLSTRLNFGAAYVKYEIVHQASGKVFQTDVQDPLGTFTWTPTMEFNGVVEIKATAYDQKHQAYPSQSQTLTVEVPRQLSLGGVKAGQTINGPVSLIAVRNFDAKATEYILLDPASGQQEYLARIPYGAYTWFPGLDYSGSRELLVRVQSMDGAWFESASVPVTLSGSNRMLLRGAGPNQVITTTVPAKLSSVANFEYTELRYVMTHAATGAQKILATLQSGAGIASDPQVAQSSTEFTYTPAQGDDGLWKLKAVAKTASGEAVETDPVNVIVYTGKLYGPQPIIEKSKFLGFASSLAVNDFRESGMSAALQTAQAILETGWGQSVPVDKYTGRLSSNLFGIKGTGPAGSVVSNTWEEYNGVAFRVDASFRAYYSANESWADHKRFLLTGARYEPFRTVMFDSSLGAWALKRAGYATDSKYPVKLMDLIETYQLIKLDEVDL
ncbi:stalk domain-containing protein [Acidaminobacter hydrogenoformans]|uniref:Flagellum-specific peptidoglycan hydrolase FlgJ n=1 Tax=Acidaminobacter hydrogenoformans DSM 2784 TaxID=1120920 RepID=A0A1G5S2D2_9FIRM|nr:stalk domain-containing protein [Acidaminobacter hydrogenoformans]SCZ79729.1 Flagellum-specific peptidoglycan hydrolase FlgJ [Acidaminobacter hydrogenoformans DSM 2784]